MSGARKTAKAARKSGKGTVSAKPKTPRSGGWWAGLCCGVLLLVSPGTSLVLGVLLLPGLAGLAVGGRSHPTARAMLLFGLAGSVGSLFDLFGAGASVGAALALIRRPTSLVEAWAAAGAGWLVTEMTAMAIVLTWMTRDGARRRQLDREIAMAEAEWGPLR